MRLVIENDVASFCSVWDGKAAGTGAIGLVIVRMGRTVSTRSAPSFLGRGQGSEGGGPPSPSRAVLPSRLGVFPSRIPSPSLLRQRGRRGVSFAVGPALSGGPKYCSTAVARPPGRSPVARGRCWRGSLVGVGDEQRLDQGSRAWCSGWRSSQDRPGRAEAGARRPRRRRRAPGPPRKLSDTTPSSGMSHPWAFMAARTSVCSKVPKPEVVGGEGPVGVVAGDAPRVQRRRPGVEVDAHQNVGLGHVGADVAAGDIAEVTLQACRARPRHRRARDGPPASPGSRETVTVNPSARSNARVSSSTASVSVASYMVWPDSVTPTLPGSMLPWPASRNTDWWRSPVVGPKDAAGPWVEDGWGQRRVRRTAQRRGGGDGPRPTTVAPTTAPPGAGRQPTSVTRTARPAARATGRRGSPRCERGRGGVPERYSTASSS